MASIKVKVKVKVTVGYGIFVAKVCNVLYSDRGRGSWQRKGEAA